MIIGIGVDISEVSRFEKWVKNKDLLCRFFNEQEMSDKESVSLLCQHYAARFAAKEAFSKALGTGILGFNLTEVFVTHDKLGKPELMLTGKAKEKFEEICGEGKIHLSLSHEKNNAIAFVVIEK